MQTNTRTIADYQIIQFLGAGGMGNVYQASHQLTGHKVALKILHEKHKHDAEVVKRFLREARVLQELHHPNIIEVFDFGQTDTGECYLAVEFLKGRTLDECLYEALPVERIVHIGLQLCAALSVVHAKGIVHRDVKAENIFLIEQSTVKLLDFGIAHTKHTAGSVATKTGKALGSPICMSPEQLLGRKIDHRSDIYSLGVLLYQMATGELPFQAKNVIALAMQHTEARPVPPIEKRPELPAALNQVILTCLEKERHQRHPSVVSLAKALASVIGEDPAPYFGFAPSADIEKILDGAIRKAKSQEPYTPPPSQPEAPKEAAKKSRFKTWFGSLLSQLAIQRSA